MSQKGLAKTSRFQNPHDQSNRSKKSGTDKRNQCVNIMKIFTGTGCATNYPPEHERSPDNPHKAIATIVSISGFLSKNYPPDKARDGKKKAGNEFSHGKSLKK